MEKGNEEIISNILRDIEVEIGDEFDRNFEREAFFSKAWPRRKSPVRAGRHLLVDSGSLRRSLRKERGRNKVSFINSHPAAALHNEGGTVKVTRRMKKYFWHRYYAAVGRFGRRKDGSRRRGSRQDRLAAEADFWRSMALMKEGSEIRMPERRFMGMSPEIERAVSRIIEENVMEYMNGIRLQKERRNR